MEQETLLVVTNLNALLLVSAGAYGVYINDHAAEDKAGQSKTPVNRNNNKNVSDVVRGVGEQDKLSN